MSGQYGERDAACPVSAGGGTRRVRSVRGREDTLAEDSLRRRAPTHGRLARVRRGARLSARGGARCCRWSLFDAVDGMSPEAERSAPGLCGEGRDVSG